MRRSHSGASSLIIARDYSRGSLSNRRSPSRSGGIAPTRRVPDHEPAAAGFSAIAASNVARAKRAADRARLVVAVLERFLDVKIKAGHLVVFICHRVSSA